MDRSRTLSPGAVGRTTHPMGLDRVASDNEPPWHVTVSHEGTPVGVFAIAGRTKIGRDTEAGADLVLPDPAVSRVHAVVAVTPGEPLVWLQDMGSSNGVFVNGKRVEGAAVRAGDVIRMGDSLLVLGRGSPAPNEDASGLGLVGQSPAIAELRGVLRKVAPSALPVLVIGPTGTGKELVARAVHEASGRRGRFIAVNCAALPGQLIESALFGHKRGAFTGAVSDQDGAFVQANGGTLFFDEVGDLALEAQPKLLRALENGEVTPIGMTKPIVTDVRVVAATHVPLDAAIERDMFRRDLFARLAGVVVRTPALSQRREDILAIFRAFLGDTPASMSADFVESLLLYRWPFNVREVRKLVERLIVLHPDVKRWELGMLDEEIRKPTAEEAARAEAPAPRKTPPNREELIELLARCDGNVSRVAELVGRNRKQVYRWMGHYALDRGTGRKA